MVKRFKCFEEEGKGWKGEKGVGRVKAGSGKLRLTFGN
jgi:hypothetical protein